MNNEEFGQFVDNINSMKAKGLTKSVCQDNLLYESYKEIIDRNIENKDVMEVAMRSKDMKIRMHQYKKRALCRSDDKVEIMSDGINSKPYGYGCK